MDKEQQRFTDTGVYSFADTLDAVRCDDTLKPISEDTTHALGELPTDLEAYASQLPKELADMMVMSHYDTRVSQLLIKDPGLTKHFNAAQQNGIAVDTAQERIQLATTYYEQKRQAEHQRVLESRLRIAEQLRKKALEHQAMIEEAYAEDERWEENRRATLLAEEVAAAEIEAWEIELDRAYGEALAEQVARDKAERERELVREVSEHTLQNLLAIDGFRAAVYAEYPDFDLLSEDKKASVVLVKFMSTYLADSSEVLATESDPSPTLNPDPTAVMASIIALSEAVKKRPEQQIPRQKKVTLKINDVVRREFMLPDAGETA